MNEALLIWDPTFKKNFNFGENEKLSVEEVIVQNLQVVIYKYLNCVERYLLKLGASSDANFLTHASPSEDVHGLLKNDVTGTFFLRE
jgi:hypothetical protein